MNKKKILVLSVTLFILFAISAKAEDSRVLQCRVLARDFMTELKGELKVAIRSGGTVKAISVCSKRAPELAARYSLPPDVQIGRTSDRWRNPDNRPDSWEQEGLVIFEKRRLQGETLAGMEYWQEVEVEGERSFRYLRATPTGSLCLRCHGEKISRMLKKILQKKYPEDQAVGFRLGELRGAFTITLSQ